MGKYYNIVDTELPKEVIQTLARYSTTTEKKMPYRKIDKGQYELYCPYCQTYKKISYSELKEIRHKQSRSEYYKFINCPTCKHEFASTSTMNSKIYNMYVYIRQDGKQLGYQVVSKWEFGKPIEPVKVSQFALFEGDDTYIKCGYALGCFGEKIIYNEDYDCMGKYRKAQSPRYYWHTFDYYTEWTLFYGSRVDKRKIYQDIHHISKSTQLKLANDLSVDDKFLCYAIGLFDINKVDDLEKYRKYLTKNREHLKDFKDTTLNIYYLDYLDRNNISLGMYFEYSENLKKLGFKLDKPTDFKHRYKVVERMATAEQDRVINEKIYERYETLPKYEKDNVSITPFELAQEIRNCGKKLHNCIGGYVQRYADKKTDIYHVDLDGAITIAMEIRDKKLQQAYGDHNSKCPTEILKHIKSFCKENGFSLGTYA